MSVTITNLELNPGEILESVCKRPAARTAAYGTGLIRVDVTSSRAMELSPFPASRFAVREPSFNTQSIP